MFSIEAIGIGAIGAAGSGAAASSNFHLTPGELTLVATVAGVISACVVAYFQRRPRPSVRERNDEASALERYAARRLATQDEEIAQLRRENERGRQHEDEDREGEARQERQRPLRAKRVGRD